MTSMKEAVSDNTGVPENKSQEKIARNDTSMKSGDGEEETSAVSKSEQDNVSEETGKLPDEKDGLVDNKVWTSLSNE